MANMMTQLSSSSLVLLAKTDPRKGGDNENRHYLELDNNERDLLTGVCNGPFKHVIVLMNIQLLILASRDTNDHYNERSMQPSILSPGANALWP